MPVSALRRSGLLPLTFLILLPVTAAAWTPIGPFGGPGGFVSLDAQSPDRLIASSRNGSLFLSVDAGREWNRLPFPWMPGAFIEAVKIHPLDPKLFFAAVSDETGEHAGLYASADGGQKWIRVPEMRGEGVFSLAMFLADTNTMGAGTRRGVFLSRDRGRTWKLAHRPGEPGPSPVMSLAFDPEDPKILYAGTTHLPWKTADGGENWRSIHDGMLDDSDVFSIHVDSKHPDKIHASACSGIYLSDSRGDKWRRVQGIPGTDRRTHVVTEDPAFSSLLFAGTTAGLWKSADAGGTWRKLNDHIVRSVEFHPRDGRIVYMATQDRGILKSTTAAFRFEEANDGFTGIPVVKVLTPAGRPAVAITVGTSGSMQLWRRTASGWKLDRSTPRFLDAAAFGPRLYLTSESTIYRESWMTPGKTAAEVASLWEALPDAAGPIRALAGGSALTVVRGKSIRRSRDGEKLMTAPASLFGLPPGVEQVFEVVTGGPWEMLRTSRGLWARGHGEPWRQAAEPPGRLFQLAASPRGLWAATTLGLHRSEDGRTWRRVESGLPDGFLNTIVQHGSKPNEWFTSQVGQVFRSTDGGETWSAWKRPLTAGLIQRLAAGGEGQQEEIFALVDGQGVYVDKTLPKF